MAKKGMWEVSVSAVFLLAVGLFAAGCGGGGGPSPAEVQQAIDQGNTSLGAASDSFEAASATPDSTFGTSYTASREELAAAEQSFSTALEGDPDNQEANLGIGLVQLMMLLGDTNEDFGVEGMMAGGAVMGGPAAMMSRRWFPGKLISRLRNRQGEPTITDFQNHLETQVIPKLEEIIGHLESVTDEGIQVQVPPDPDPENPDNYRIVDYGDVLLLRAIVYQVLDLARSAVVYNLDPGTFYDAGPTLPDLDTDPDDWILTPAEFLPPDPFLTLRPNGVGHSREALDDERHAMSSLVAAIDFMLAEYEAGTQDHEVIPVGPSVGPGSEEARPEDLARMRSLATLFTRILTEAYWLNPSVEIDPTAPDVDILIDLPTFANNPPADLKDLVPDLTYEQDPISEEYFVSGVGALPDPTFAGLLPEGVPVTAVAALLKK